MHGVSTGIAIIIPVIFIRPDDDDRMKMVRHHDKRPQGQIHIRPDTGGFYPFGFGDFTYFR